MNSGKYIFSQLTEFLPRRVFDGIVEKHNGNKKVRSFPRCRAIVSRGNIILRERI